MAGNVWGGMPGYISNLFRRKKEQETPRTAPVTPMTPERQKQEDSFRALMSEINPAALDDAPPPAPESTGGAIGRGLAGFLGFVPQGGTRGDAADGWANLARGLLGAPSVQQVESDYNQSINPERLRRAIESGDRDAIARIDPAVARQVQQIERTDADAAIAAEDRTRRISVEDGERERLLAIREAVEAGDIERVKQLDPQLHASLFGQSEKEEQSRRDRGIAATRAAERMGEQNFPMVLDAMVADGTINLTPEELAFGKANGAQALRELLGQEIAERDPLADAYRRAQIASLNRRGAGSGGDEDGAPPSKAKMKFTGTLKNLGGTTIELARAGAIGVGGEGGSLTSILGAGAGKEGLGGTVADLATLGNVGSAPLFSRRNTQVDLAIRQFAEAAGIKTGALNSNFELQNVKNALANPLAPMEDQIAAQDAMSATYGSGELVSDYLLRQGQITPQEYADIQVRTEAFVGNIERGVAQEASGGAGRSVAGGTITEGADGVREWTPGGR